MSILSSMRGSGRAARFGELRAKLRLIVAIVLATSLSFTAVPGEVFAEHPRSPRVQQMLKEGLRYLEKDSTKEGTFGGKALMAYTMMKLEKAIDPPKYDHSPATQDRIDDAVDAIRTAMKEDKSKKDNTNSWRAMYSPAISVMFLSELNSDKYKSEIQEILDYILSRQRADGSFGYIRGSAANQFGDTSQTQYVVLAFWYLMKHDFQIPKERVQRLMNWFMKTQQGNGGYAYHIAPDGRAESAPTKTMGVAGTGSLYIIGNFTGILAPKKKKTQFDGLPATVTIYIDKKDRKRDDFAIQSSGLSQSLGRGDKWLAANPGYEDKGWYLYYMYGYERYRAFYDIAKGVNEDEPQWYNTGVNHLEKLQNADGSWGEVRNYNPAVNSCFALLFLMRNTKASVKQFEEGDMVAIGPLGEGELFINGDGIEVGKAGKDVNELFAITDQIEPQDWGAFRSTMSELKLSTEPKERKKQLEKMRGLVSHRDFEARIIAVEQLGRRRDFESVPELIYALGDPDKRVAIASHTALRVLSRKFDMADMKNNGEANYSDKDVESFSRLKREWKKWYRERKPDAVFLD